MSELHYGVNVENLLHELSQYESEDIGEFDVYGEDESGCEGAATIDITLLASDAFSLIAELKAQRDALADENAALKDYLKECSVVQGEGNWTSDAEKSVYVPASEWNPLTPATDAYLNSVRADAVQALWDDSLNDVGRVLGEIRAYDDASEAGGIVHDEIKERVDEFLTQLRAGEPS